jgi:Fe-S-cluster containining protein
MSLSCKRCGKCCLEWGAYFVLITEGDIERWRNEGRMDILQYLEFLEGNIAFGWIHPQTKEKLSRCPFLLYEIDTSRYLCKIHNTKPKRCKDYYCSSL